MTLRSHPKREDWDVTATLLKGLRIEMLQHVLCWSDLLQYRGSPQQWAPCLATLSHLNKALKANLVLTDPLKDNGSIL